MRHFIFSTRTLLAAVGCWLLAASQTYADLLTGPAAPTVAEAGSLAYYPAAARAAGVEGKVILRCDGLDHGAPRGCRIVSEAPIGQGFGAAALAMVSHAAQNPALPRATYGFRMEVVFKLNPPSIEPDLLREPRSTGMPMWSERPSGEDIARVYPRDAARTGFGGRVDMICKVETDGRMSGCTATAVPPGRGFEEAALALAPLFRMKWTGGAAPAEKGTVHIPIRFTAGR